MPGHIGSVAASVGDAVKAGDHLLRIEAMKMETSIHAEHSGVIKKIHVEPGAASTPRTY